MQFWHLSSQTWRLMRFTLAKNSAAVSDAYIVLMVLLLAKEVEVTYGTLPQQRTYGGHSGATNKLASRAYGRWTWFPQSQRNRVMFIGIG